MYHVTLQNLHRSKKNKHFKKNTCLDINQPTYTV